MLFVVCTLLGKTIPKLCEGLWHQPKRVAIFDKCKKTGGFTYKYLSRIHTK